MATSTERVLEDLHRVVAELEEARDRLSDLGDAARKNARRSVRAADHYVRDNAWETLGAAAAAAFLAGFLLGRRD